LPLIARRSIPSITSTTNRARCFSGSHSSTDGGRRNPVWRSIVRKLFIGATFVAMENHRTDSIPNDSYPVKSDRLLGTFFPWVWVAILVQVVTGYALLFSAYGSLATVPFH